MVADDFAGIDPGWDLERLGDDVGRSLPVCRFQIDLVTGDELFQIPEHDRPDTPPVFMAGHDDVRAVARCRKGFVPPNIPGILRNLHHTLNNAYLLNLRRDRDLRNIDLDRIEDAFGLGDGAVANVSAESFGIEFGQVTAADRAGVEPTSRRQLQSDHSDLDLL